MSSFSKMCDAGAGLGAVARHGLALGDRADLCAGRLLVSLPFLYTHTHTAAHHLWPTDWLSPTLTVKCWCSAPPTRRSLTPPLTGVYIHRTHTRKHARSTHRESGLTVVAGAPHIWSCTKAAQLGTVELPASRGCNGHEARCGIRGIIIC